MNAEQLILLAVKASIMLLVFAIGLHARWHDTTYLLRRPGLMLRSLLSMGVIMPLFAAGIAAFFDLNPAVKITIIALALAPVPPILPSKQEKAGGTPSYGVSLLVMAALFAIVLVPLDVELMGQAFGKEAHMAPGAVAMIVLMSVLAPLAAGLIIGGLARSLADRIARPVSMFATILLIVAVLPVLFTAWPVVMSMIGNGTLLALALFTIVGLAAGHWLGGSNEDNRTILALATSARHPAIALATASANFDQPKQILAVVLLHLVVGAIVSIPYVIWRKRRHANAAAELPT